MRIRNFFILFLVPVIFALTGCNSSEVNKDRKLVMATQIGLSHSGTILMNELGILKKNLPDDVKVELVEITGGGAAVREAITTNNVNIGGMGIPPFLIGVDKGMELKLLNGFAVNKYMLVANKDNIQSIEDIDDSDKIAILQYGSINHIMLSMMSKKVFNDANKFENNMVIMPESDSVAAMESGAEVSLYLGSQPTVQKAINLENTHVIADVEDYIGKITTVVAVTNDKYSKENPDICEAYVKSLEETFQYMKENKEECIEILAEKFNMSAEELKDIYNKVLFSTNIYGFDEIGEFMYENGYIESKPLTLKEVMSK